jgi:hypothetical protein
MIAKHILTNEASHSIAAHQYYLNLGIIALLLTKNLLNFNRFPLA